VHCPRQNVLFLTQRPFVSPLLPSLRAQLLYSLPDKSSFSEQQLQSALQRVERKKKQISFVFVDCWQFFAGQSGQVLCVAGRSHRLVDASESRRSAKKTTKQSNVLTLWFVSKAQRLAFARAVLWEESERARHPTLWIFFDEATSALDGENEERMMGLVLELKVKFVSIAHRSVRKYHDAVLTLLDNNTWTFERT
jgi:ABC-type uncharacterized transport system fused permease/ATPase subunit